MLAGSAEVTLARAFAAPRCLGVALRAAGLVHEGSAREELLRERRVAQMAAEGMINREIAQSLFVTEKTVETHLGKTYAKLKVRARTELPGILTNSLTA